MKDRYSGGDLTRKTITSPIKASIPVSDNSPPQRTPSSLSSGFRSGPPWNR